MAYRVRPRRRLGGGHNLTPLAHWTIGQTWPPSGRYEFRCAVTSTGSWEVVADINIYAIPPWTYIDKGFAANGGKDESGMRPHV